MDKIFQKGDKLYETLYIVDGWFDKGGMNSQVYRVYLPNNPKKLYAAKVIYKDKDSTNDFWRRFGDEAITSLRILKKENLVQTYEVIKDLNHELIILIMDYVEGISLRKYLSLNGCIVPKLALSIFLKILNGVKELHNFQQTIIHRDLKPENILLSHDLSKVTIIDFGISTIIERTETYLHNSNLKCYTDESAIRGTYPYVIPDVLTSINHKTKVIDYKKINVQADFYSLGVILYEMLMGKKPFDTSNIDEKNKSNAYRIIKLPLVFDILNISVNPSIPAALENIIFRCLACKENDLQYRYKKIEEIIKDVENVIDILDKKTPDTKLLKPINERVYQKETKFNLVYERSKLPFYKHYWFFAIIAVLCIAILIIALLCFFVF